MPTIRYELENGTAVTGTTTIINEFKNLSQTSWGTAMHISQRPCQIGDKPV